MLKFSENRFQELITSMGAVLRNPFPSFCVTLYAGVGRRKVKVIQTLGSRGFYGRNLCE